MQSDTMKNEFENNAGTPGKSANSDLEEQVARLREDVAGVAEALKALAAERADGAKRQAYAMRDDVRERGEQYLKQAQDTVSEFEEHLSERVRSEPVKAVVIAVAAGYIYGRLFSR